MLPKDSQGKQLHQRQVNMFIMAQCNDVTKGHKWDASISDSCIKTGLHMASRAFMCPGSHSLFGYIKDIGLISCPGSETEQPPHKIFFIVATEIIQNQNLHVNY